VANADSGGPDAGYAGSERAPYPGDEVEDGAQYSIPWQNRSRFPSLFGALWETIKAVLFEPTRAFSNPRVEGSFGKSLLFILLLGSIGVIVGLLWQVGLRTLHVRMGMAGGGHWAGVGFGTRVVLTVVIVPVLIVVGSILNAGVLHLCLMILGGANRTFEATYAVVAYAGGSTSLLTLIPFCGGLIGGVWNIVLQVIGLREAHRTTTGRAVLAVLVPLIFCCGVVMVLVMAISQAALAARAA